MPSCTVAIVHGKSEIMLCRELEKATRTRIHIYSRNRGEECIQLRQLPEILSSQPFRSESELHREFSELDYDASKETVPHLEIYTIVDTDDSPLEKRAYITGNLLRGCPLEDKVFPVFNDPNLDAVFESHGFPIDGNNKVRSYRAVLQSIDFLELYRMLRNDDMTNLDQFIRKMLKRVPELQSKLG